MQFINPQLLDTQVEPSDGYEQLDYGGWNLDCLTSISSTCSDSPVDSVLDGEYTWMNHDIEFSDFENDDVDSIKVLDYDSDEVVEIPQFNENSFSLDLFDVDVECKQFYIHYRRTRREFNLKISYNSGKLINSLKHQFENIEELLEDPTYFNPNHDIIKFNPSAMTSEILSKFNYAQKLNVYELASILKIEDFNIELTRKIESDILDIFGKYCNFELGKFTWCRGTTKQERYNHIDFLFRIFNNIYPINKQILGIIIKRGTYRLVQYKSRIEKRNRSMSH